MWEGSSKVCSGSSLRGLQEDNSFKDEHWFALRVRPRFEKKVHLQLINKGYDTFLPLYTVRRRWSDRIQRVELPLFSGYLFSKFDLNRRLPILTTPGVLQLVGVGKMPVPVSDQELGNVRLMVEAGHDVMPWGYLEAGDQVEVLEGPLAGMRGQLVSLRSGSRLVIKVNLLARAVAAEVERKWLRKVAEPREGLATARLAATAVHG